MADYRKYLDPEILTKISRLELRARMIVEGFISGMHRSPYNGFSVEFAAHREYVPGDDIRHIDWRLFARGDRLYVKQYEEETNLRTQVLLDCSKSMAYPEDEGNKERGGKPRGSLSSAGSQAFGRNKFDYAATLAASLIYLLMHQQDACGLVLFDREVREQIAPTSQTAQLRGMIELIERRGPQGVTEMRMLLAGLAERLHTRGLVVLISDLLGNVEDIIEGLRQFRHRRQDVIVLHVLDHDELNFPFDANTQFEGLEQPEFRALVDPQALRESYLRIVQQFISRVRSACMDNSIDYCLLSTHDPPDAGLSAYLAGRMHRLRK